MLNTCSPSSYADTKTSGQRTSWLCDRSCQSAVQAPIGSVIACTLPSSPGRRSKMRGGAYWYSVSAAANLPSGVGVKVWADWTPATAPVDVVRLGGSGRVTPEPKSPTQPAPVDLVCL